MAVCDTCGQSWVLFWKPANTVERCPACQAKNRRQRLRVKKQRLKKKPAPAQTSVTVAAPPKYTGPMPNPTVDTWVSKDPDGRPRLVKVVDMEDSHLLRWIQYFRRKFRNGGKQGSDAQIDLFIRQSIVTAPAIYAEAKKRGVIIDYVVGVDWGKGPSVTVVHPAPLAKSLTPEPPKPKPGTRLITMDGWEDD
ncbi:MAG: hypothetical protein Q7J25_12250 [Vicinamibacterales bacterium]|nr:hypothetical protein [Vicinamibacterales bacterium]